MALTPVEIRHMRPPKSLLGGYRRDPTERLFEEIVASFEDVWRERADLADKVEHLEAELARFRELENVLRTTLVSAERASHELRAQARKQAELIVSDAQNEARSLVRDARAEGERLLAESNRIKGMLRAALETVEQGTAKAKAA